LSIVPSARAITEQRFGCKVASLVDLYHLTEKLAAAARIIDPDSGALLQRWKMRLIHRSDDAKGILEELIGSGQDEDPGDSHHEDADRMHYVRARRLGMPLGIGNVEATCKSLFEMRLKRFGERWNNETGQHIVQLRAFALSDRWKPAVELTLRPLRQAVRAAA